MLQAILGFLGIIPAITNTINGITQAISNEKIAALNAKTDQDRIAAEERVTSLQAQRDVLIADAAHSNWDIYERAFIATPVGLLLWKLFVYDDMLGWGTTNIPNSSYQWYVILAVVGFYFVNSLGSMFKR